MMNYTLSDSICFGASGGDCFAVVGLQSYPWIERKVKFHLFSIDPNVTLSLWGGLSMGPTPMFNMDKRGHILWKFLQEFIGDKAAPHFVRIRLLRFSTHFVYQLNFPELACKDTGKKGQQILTIFKDRLQGIAVKVIFDSHLFFKVEFFYFVERKVR